MWETEMKQLRDRMDEFYDDMREIKDAIKGEGYSHHLQPAPPNTHTLSLGEEGLKLEPLPRTTREPIPPETPQRNFWACFGCRYRCRFSQKSESYPCGCINACLFDDPPASEWELIGADEA